MIIPYALIPKPKSFEHWSKTTRMIHLTPFNSSKGLELFQFRMRSEQGGALNQLRLFILGCSASEVWLTDWPINTSLAWRLFGLCAEMPKGLIVLHGKLMKLSYGPGQKSFGRWCNIRNYLRRLDALIKWGHLLQSTSQFSLLPTFKMLYSEKFWIHLSNVVFEVGEGLGMCDLTKKKKKTNLSQVFCPWL